MRHFLLFIIMAVAGLTAVSAQNAAFNCTIYNKEYKIYITMDLYDKDVIIPGQEILGPVDGFIGSEQCAHVWTFTTSDVTNSTTAHFEATNNYGSEDFSAKLTLNDDGSYTMRHTGGSTLKFPVKNKWQKIPSTLTFTPREAE